MTSSLPEIGNTRLVWIEWVRGIAALVVVLSHFLDGVVPAFHDFSREVFDPGRAGVVAFFLVSGFVIPLSYRRQSTNVFIVRRLTRLYPIYWIVLVVTALLSARADWTSPAWWGELLLNATMLQQLFMASMITVAWTLTIEIIYYFQQIAAKTIRQLDRSWIVGYFWVAVFAGAVAAERVLDRELPISFPMLLAVACVGHAMSLSFGGLLAKKHTITITVVVTATIVVAGLLRADVDPLWPPLLYVVSFLGGIALFGLAYLARNRFELRWAVWLGGISYALYLSHSVTGGFIRAAPDDLLWPAFLAALSSAILSAWLLHKYVELPCIRWGRSYKPATAASRGVRRAADEPR